jgi:subtilase family serine protease
VEISLDLDAVSAACPGCHILLVEGNSPDVRDLGIAENTAVRLGADVVSNSYGLSEFNGMQTLGKRYYTHPGTAIVASSGDFGFGIPQFPAVMKSTIAVGGTSLTRSPTPRGWTEHAWWGAGSGCSGYVTKPTWQKDAHCPTRMVADVSAVADPDSGFLVNDTFGLGPHAGYIRVGGTSLSAPLIAGMIARAGNPRALSNAGYIYRHAGALHDVRGGSNGYCGGDYLCTGRPGYDGPTGLGSPRGLAAL